MVKVDVMLTSQNTVVIMLAQWTDDYISCHVMWPLPITF